MYTNHTEERRVNTVALQPARSPAPPMPGRVASRRFAPEDAASVHQIGADTACFGDPVELILDDRRLFIDAFMRPYTTHCAATCWVAEADGHVIGYLTGCLDTATFGPALQRALLHAAGRLLAGRYRVGRRTLRAGIGYLREVASRRPQADLAAYPAHLHINLSAAYRGQGIGRRLMLAYLDQCRAAGAPGVHLSTSDHNVAAVQMYRALGFSVLHRRPAPYLSTVNRRAVEALIMGLRLV